MILYKTLFSGWVEVTPEAKERIVQHLQSGITAISNKNSERDKYIASRFKEVVVGHTNTQ